MEGEKMPFSSLQCKCLLKTTFAYILIAAVLAAFASVATAEFNGYEALSDWASLPLSKTGITAGLASSYDRAGGNNDFNYYQSPTGLQDSNVDTTITTLTGPGVITRFWMPHAAADGAFDVKITVDGSLLIDTNSDALLGGSYGYMQSPLVSTLVGGQVSYEPIVFQNSLVIESNNYASGGWAKEHHYYQYNYHKLPGGTTVTPYSGTLTSSQQQARNTAVSMINNVGSNPAGTSSSSTVSNLAGQSIAGGSSVKIADVTGSGTIRRLNLKMAGASDTDLDGLRLRVRYDGKTENAIDVPVSHFFGAGHGRVEYQSLPLGTDSEDGFYSYWPMPYHNQVEVELYNSTGSAISINSAAVEYESGDVSNDAGYLHAVYNEETTTDGQQYHSLLNVEGKGHYVGNLLYLQTPDMQRGILEGDEIITVDGTNVLYGTGLEDAYNGGYYYNHVIEQSDDGDVPDATSGDGPYHGLLRMNFDDTGDDYVRTDQYRWYIGDYVPFTDGIDIKIENFGQNEDILFGSTSFYYAVPEPATLSLLAIGGLGLVKRK